MKDKYKINFIIDVIMFINMMAIAGIGFLIKYTLIPGYKRNAIYGRNDDLNFLGLDRHEWGSVHLTLSLIFIGLLVLHIVLHWKTIVCLYKRYIERKAVRYFTTSILVVCTLVFVLFSFIIKPEIVEFRYNESKYHSNIPDFNLNIEETSEGPLKEPLKLEIHKGLHHNLKQYDIHGYMTLYDISQKYDIPSDYIKAQLNIPEIESSNTKLGWLNKQYNFKMSDVSLAVEKYSTH